MSRDVEYLIQEQAARRGRRGEGASVSSGSGVSRLRVLLAEGGSPR